MHDHVHNPSVRFVWDERKRRANLKKHGLGFADAWKVFAGAMVLIEDDREDYGEQRLLGIGLLEVLVVVVVHTEGSGTIRVISMREAERHEKDRYYLEAGV